MTSRHRRGGFVVGQVLVATQLLDQRGEHASQLQEVAQDPPAFVGQDRLGMELHAVHRPRRDGGRAMIVPSSLRARRHLELGRQRRRRRRPASDSGRPGTAPSMPLNTPWPSCSTVEVLPCIGVGARTTVPPKTAPIA